MASELIVAAAPAARQSHSEINLIALLSSSLTICLCWSKVTRRRTPTNTGGTQYDHSSAMGPLQRVLWPAPGHGHLGGLRSGANLAERRARRVELRHRSLRD